MRKEGMLGTVLLLLLFPMRCAGKANPEFLAGQGLNTFIGNKYLNIVAHQDDDLLFMNPDIALRIQKRSAVETVYITAGDKNKAKRYWSAREDGVKVAYAYMAKAANDWVEEDLELFGHKLVRFILRQEPKIRLIFLRLPDGIDFRDGAVTLNTIWQHDEVIIYSKDQKNRYRKYELVKILTGLMDDYQPDVIEYVYPGNHVDHQYTAKFAELAERAYQRKHAVIRYQDYNISKSPPNLDEFNASLKWAIAQHYGKYDKYFPKYGFERMFGRYYGWCERQYYYETREKSAANDKLVLNNLLFNGLNNGKAGLSGITFPPKLTSKPQRKTASPRRVNHFSKSLFPAGR